MSESEGASIDLSVNADEALQVFAQLASAARDADEQVQQLKQHLAAQVTTAFGVQGQQPQTYQQASAVLSRMDPTEVAQAAPEIAQTRQALNVRRAEMTSRAMDFVGANPQVVTQPLPDTLAQFQQAMAERAQQQQSQRERQAQQQAAGVERPARYGYETTPPPPQPPQAMSRPIPATTPAMQVAGPMSMAPLATTGDARLAQALSVQAPPIPAMGTSAGRGDNAATSALPDDLQRLATAAIAADEGIRRLQERLVEQVNAQMGAAGIRPQTFEQAQDLLGRMPAADLAAAAPDVVVTQQRIADRSAQVTGQAADFAGANPQAAGQPVTPQLLTQFQEAQARQAEQSQRQQEAQQARQPQPTASSSVPSGALPGDPVSTAARYGQAPASTPLSPFGQPGASTNDTTQQDRAGTQLGERFAQALTRSGVGMVTGGIQGAASAAGMGATGDLVGALARPLMELVSAPLAIGAAVIGGAAGIGLGVNALQSKYAGEQQGLAGSVGTTTGATPSSELTTAQQAGWSMMYHEADSVAAARQLGDMGVQSGQLGAGLTASMALSRVGGIGLDQTTNLTGSLMQSGMSGNQVGDYFAQLDQAARQSGVSVARLTEGIVHLNQAAGIGQISVNGLAAAQALTDQTGTKIDIAQAMSGAIGATGTTALSQGALLGLNPAQFEAATQDPARLLDAYAGLAKRYDVGTGGVQVAQQAMSAAGFDFSKMDSHQADVFTRKLVSEGPNAAQRYEDTLTRKENAPGAPGPHNFAELTQASVTVAHNITSASEQAKLDFEQGGNALVRGADKAGQSLTDAIAHHNLAAVSADTGGSATQRMARERHSDPRAYVADTEGNTSVTATQQGPYVNTFDAYKLNAAEANGLTLPGGGHMTSETFLALQQASQRTHDPLAVLLSQAGREATNPRTGLVDPSIVSSDGGYGLGQFTDPGAAVKYLGQASHELGLGAVTASNWHQAALNPKIAAQGMADYDAANYASKEAGGRWDHALAQYNAGPNGWNYTGHPGQGRDYGTTVDQGALKVEVQLGGSVDITQDGHKVGSAQAGQHIRATATHSVDPTRRHVASQSYGPQDRTPPAPGIPTLPGHFGGPIRR